MGARMSYELISEDEYASLPEEDDKCFVAFENICRRNMTRMIDENTSSHFDSSVREQYMVHVSKVAEACHILHVAYDPTEGGDFNIVFAQFCLAVQVKSRVFEFYRAVSGIPIPFS